MSTRSPEPAHGTLISRLVQAITDAVARGELLPGQRLVEADLQQRFGAGRSSVREALQLLHSSGLVMIEANKGAAVRKLDARELQDLFAIREQLEGLAAQLAAHNMAQAKPTQRKLLSTLMQRMEKAATQGDAQAYNLLNREFHQLLLTLSGNTQLQRLVAQLNLPILVQQFRGFMQPANQLASQAEHTCIAQAVLDGDGAAAQRLMQKHVRSGLKLVQQWAAQS
jgi:DNA-binding GntR family transcriptional regulator